MKLLYIAPRYHTNQVPVMKGWHDRGVEVHFFAQFEGVSEVHDYVNFHLMKPSAATVKKFERLERENGAAVAESMKIRAFMPDFPALYRSIREIMPDVVIVREYSKPNAMAVLACRMLGIRNIVMYVQIPLYGREEKYGIGKQIFRKLCFPKACFTPVLWTDTFREKLLPPHFPGAPRWFVPMICQAEADADREYCRDGIVRILDVGKYREYKNHFFFVDGIAAMQHRENIRVTIIGQLSNDSEREYYERLKAYITEKKLENVIDIRGNVPFREMQGIYDSNDVLVLSSSKDMASVVVLEAMSMGLCVASSIYNGLACYLEEHQCGYTFDLDQPERLSVILDELVQNPEIVGQMGRKGRQVAAESFTFDSYAAHLNELTKAEYGFDLESGK